MARSSSFEVDPMLSVVDTNNFSQADDASAIPLFLRCAGSASLPNENGPVHGAQVLSVPSNVKDDQQ